MILQFDDIVMQVIARLKRVIPQGSAGPPPTPKVANIIPMEKAQEQIDTFFQNSQEQSQILVTYSGNEGEGGRNVTDYQNTLNETTQRIAHTIEIHICTRRYMFEDLTKPGNTMLRLMWTVRAALTGLKMYARDESGAVIYDEMSKQTEGMFLIESYPHQNFPGTVSVCRFQCIEVVMQDDDIAPETIWGMYQEIDLQEFSQADGQTPDIGSEQRNVGGDVLLNVDNDYLPSGTPETTEEIVT